MGNPFALKTEALSTEMRLLLAILAAEKAEDLPVRFPDLFREADWEEFVKLALHHRVYPNLYPRMKNLGEAVPGEVTGCLFAHYSRNTFQMLHLSAEMEFLDGELARRNIRALFLKGPVIAKDLYGDISMRTSCDLDLLIPLVELSGAEVMLTSLGYIKDDYIHTVLNDWKWRHHHTTFTHPKKGVKVELHWRLNPAPSGEPDFEELWERRRLSKLTGRPVAYLGKEDLFLFLVSHGARHGWSRLRWLLDIKQLLLQRPDAGRLIALLRKHRYYHVGGQALTLARELLDAEIAGELGRMERAPKSRAMAQGAMFYLERMVNLHSLPVPEDVASYHKRHQFALFSPVQKLVFVLSFLFPYPEDAETLPLPKPLHFLYVPLRPFLWAWRKSKRFT
ncbi:nucleotidyltransferase family protein [Paenibacillus sp. 7124]|uniref:Nucleotidyltransferase family protein n=1 Tax=Paenibacillus apii TaxID=1850370 RepID=A0A6M1PPA8_9BACL|nr:nucleotidyltransferase family protein [Paenibacillus apii]NGM85587.1 nucleotidyltransferase family protein [Paenibacillus apii]